MSQHAAAPWRTSSPSTQPTALRHRPTGDPGQKKHFFRLKTLKCNAAARSPVSTVSRDRELERIASKYTASSPVGPHTEHCTVLYCTVLYCTVLYYATGGAAHGVPQQEDEGADGGQQQTSLQPGLLHQAGLRAHQGEYYPLTYYPQQ